jgi:uncharacterized membrane protein YuzA (DUF378 family)
MPVRFDSAFPSHGLQQVNCGIVAVACMAIALAIVGASIVVIIVIIVGAATVVVLSIFFHHASA